MRFATAPAVGTRTTPSTLLSTRRAAKTSRDGSNEGAAHCVGTPVSGAGAVTRIWVTSRLG